MTNKEENARAQGIVIGACIVSFVWVASSLISLWTVNSRNEIDVIATFNLETGKISIKRNVE